jgi:branched-subunit amino acid transport protein
MVIIESIGLLGVFVIDVGDLPKGFISGLLNLPVELIIDLLDFAVVLLIHLVQFLQVFLFFLGVGSFDLLDFFLELLVFIDNCALIRAVFLSVLMESDDCLLNMHLQFSSLGL